MTASNATAADESLDALTDAPPGLLVAISARLASAPPRSYRPRAERGIAFAPKPTAVDARTESGCPSRG